MDRLPISSWLRLRLIHLCAAVMCFAVTRELSLAVDRAHISSGRLCKLISLFCCRRVSENIISPLICAAIRWRFHHMLWLLFCFCVSFSLWEALLLTHQKFWCLSEKYFDVGSATHWIYYRIGSSLAFFSFFFVGNSHTLLSNPLDW